MQSGIRCPAALTIPPPGSRRLFIFSPSVPHSCTARPSPAGCLSLPAVPSSGKPLRRAITVLPAAVSRRLTFSFPFPCAVFSCIGSHIPPWPRKQEARSVLPTQKAPREERFFGISDQSTNTAFLYSSGISMPRMEALVLLMMTVRSAGSCTGISCGLPLPSRMSAAMSPAWMPVL